MLSVLHAIIGSVLLLYRLAIFNQLTPCDRRHSGDNQLIDALWSSTLAIFNRLTPCDRRHSGDIQPINALWSSILWRYFADWRPVMDRHSGDILPIDALWSTDTLAIIRRLTLCDRPTIWRYSADWHTVIDRHSGDIPPIDALWSTDTFAIFRRLTPCDRPTLWRYSADWRPVIGRLSVDNVITLLYCNERAHLMLLNFCPILFCYSPAAIILHLLLNNESMSEG